MRAYRPAGQEFRFPCPVLELEPFEINAPYQVTPTPDSSHADPTLLTLLAQTVGLVGGANRRVEIWSAQNGLILKTAGGSDFNITPDGGVIQRIGNDEPWPKLDREILVGPVLILALALRGVWCLHASAVTCNGRAILFLGESGQGKSTLAAYLASMMQLVVDDVLPVTLTDSGLTCWPHFPQLKLPLDAQPGPSLPESLPAGHICLLDTAEDISLRPLTPSETTKILLRHTAGTRLFPPALLAKHLAFCAQAAGKIQLSRLAYPRRMDALPGVKALLETLC